MTTTTDPTTKKADATIQLLRERVRAAQQQLDDLQALLVPAPQCEEEIEAFRIIANKAVMRIADEMLPKWPAEDRDRLDKSLRHKLEIILSDLDRHLDRMRTLVRSGSACRALDNRQICDRGS